MNEHSPTTTVHGVFLDVLGFGVLLRGASAIGKSELALGLLNRGHRLVADDAVDIKQVSPDTLIGSCPPLLQDFLEVRGLGILNIRVMFGDNAIKTSKRLQLIVKLATFSDDELKLIDRLHGMYRLEHILEVPVPEVTIPVAPGRNLAVLIETAVRNQVIKHNGYDASNEFILRQHQLMRGDSAP
jgi:HPr kinase/phosphorylase